MSRGYDIFQKFENRGYVYFDELKHMVNYICGHLNSDTSTISIRICPRIILFAGGDLARVFNQWQNGERPFVKMN